MVEEGALGGLGLGGGVEEQGVRAQVEVVLAEVDLVVFCQDQALELD